MKRGNRGNGQFAMPTLSIPLRMKLTRRSVSIRIGYGPFNSFEDETFRVANVPIVVVGFQFL